MLIDDLRLTLITAIHTAVPALDTRMLAALRHTPRDLIVTTTMDSGPAGWVVLRSPTRAWLEAVLCDRALVIGPEPHPTPTQRRHVTHRYRRHPRMDCAPSVTAALLQALEVQPGHRVLHAGVGSGYATALLAHLAETPECVIATDPSSQRVLHLRTLLDRLGPAIDATLAAHDEPLVHHDPVDRVLCTEAVPDIPEVWLHHATPGARIVAPLDRWSAGTLLVTLTVDADGATGTLTPSPGMIPPLVRSRPALAHAARETVQPHQGRWRHTRLPHTVVTDTRHPAHLVAALLAGGIDHLPDTTRTGERHWFARVDGSWACHTTDGDQHWVREGGPSRLWTTLETTRDLWHDLGDPSWNQLGLCITPEGVHTLHLTTHPEQTWLLTPLT